VESACLLQHWIGFFQRFSYSMFPGILRGVKDQERCRRYLNTFIFHFRPRTVPERTLQFTLTWGLGGMAVVLILMLFGTGVLLKFAYHPFPDKAYESILHLQHDIRFGQLIRNIHHWSANILTGLRPRQWLRPWRVDDVVLGVGADLGFYS